MKFKEYLKKGLVSFAVISVIIPAINVSALEKSESDETSSISQSIDLENLSDDATISEVMTYDEMIQEISKNENISTEEAEELMAETAWMSYDELIEDIADSENISIEEAKTIVDDSNMKQTKDGSLVRANTYRTLKQSVTVTSTYKPTINWYCSTSESGSFHGIIKVLNTSLNRSYNSISKTFSGTLYTKLETANKIHYILNGDFYNNGTITLSGGGSIGISQTSSITFGLSYSTSFYKYIYKASNYIF